MAVKGEEWEVREERTRGGGKRERERKRRRSEGQTRYFLGSKCNLSTRSLADRCEHFTVREYDFKGLLKKKSDKSMQRAQNLETNDVFVKCFKTFHTKT